MKKKAVCLMIACLSLFTYPGLLKAGAAAAVNPVNTEAVIPPNLSPAMEKKINEFQKHHPDLFKKDKKTAGTSSSEGVKRDGGVLIISGGALFLILIILLIILL